MTKEKAVVILDKSIEYLLYLMIFFIPISIAAIEIIFTISFFLFLFKKILNPDFNFFKNPTHIFLLLFFGFCALSLFNSGIYFAKSLKALLAKWSEYILIFILVEDTLNTSRKVRNAITIIFLTAGLISLDALFQQFKGIDFIRYHPLHRQLHRAYVTASFENQNGLAAYLLPSIILVNILLFFQLIREKKYYNTYLLFSLYLLSTTVFILTESRGAWLGFILGLFLWAFLSRDKKILLSICIFIIILILMPASKIRITETFKPAGDSGRFAIWHSGIAMIKENPFLGKGLGTYMDHFRRYATIPGVYYAHNCYLQIWAEAGILSLLSFIFFVGSILYKGIRAFKNSSDILLGGVICVIIGLLFHMFFEVHLYSLQLATLSWFMLGLTMAKINA